MHGLGIGGEDCCGVAAIFYRCKNVHAEGFGAGAGGFFVFTCVSGAGTLFTQGAFIHEKQEGFVVSGKKNGSFEREQFSVYIPAPFETVERVFK